MTVRFLVTCALAVLLTASTSFAQTRDAKAANAATWRPRARRGHLRRRRGAIRICRRSGRATPPSAFRCSDPRQLGTKAELTDAGVRREGEARQRHAHDRAENAVGSFRNDNSWLTRSFRQTSLIVDPPDGRAPPLVPGAEQRRTPQGTYGNGPLDSPRTSRSTTAASRSAWSAR